MDRPSPRDEDSAIGALRKAAAAPVRARWKVDIAGTVARLPPGDPHVAAWAEEARRFSRACGCSSGAAAALGGLAITGAWCAAAVHGGLAVKAGVWLLVALPATALLTVLGKRLGLVLAQRRFRRATLTLIAQLGGAVVPTGQTPSAPFSWANRPL